MTASERELSSRLSRAGREALEEHLLAERLHILTEAIRLSDGAPLSAFDVVNAVDLIAVREREAPLRRHTPPLRLWSSSTLDWLLAAILSLLALTCLLLVLIEPGQGTALSGALQQGVVAVGVGITVAGLAVMVASMVRNLRRRQAYESNVLAVQQVDEIYRDWAMGSATTDTVRAVDSWKFRSQGPRAVGSFVANWSLLEEQLRELGSGVLGIPSADARRYPFGELLRELQRNGILTPGDYQTLRELLALRNAVIHRGDFDLADLERADSTIPGFLIELKSRAHRMRKN